MANLSDFRNARSTATATIANGASESGAITLGGQKPVGLITPTAWTTGAITFLVSADGTTYVPLYDATGTEVDIPSASIATNAARAFALNPADFRAWGYVKVRSGVNGTAVNQGAERAVTLIYAPVE